MIKRVAALPKLEATPMPTPDQNEFVVPVEPQDIGAELLPILSKGLYTDPFHAVREYVQNAVDASATEVLIKLTANSIHINDNGAGMSYDALVQARQFGVSRKTFSEHVGFRGIGVYSAFDLCKRLHITTYVAGDSHRSVLTFDFESMKRQLAVDRSSAGKKTALHELLGEHSFFRRESAPAPKVGTHVQLEDVEPYHLRRLRSEQALDRYIRQNLPIDFEETFEHRDEIKTHLKALVQGYKSVGITLDIEGGKTSSFPSRVRRPAIPNLDKPQFHNIVARNGTVIGVVWSCLYLEGKKIPSPFEEYRGFVYKVKGFTIGNQSRLRHLFKLGSSTLYDWYTGEVYVIDEAILPNTERNDFEAGTAYEEFQLSLKGVLNQLEKQASSFQVRRNAEDKISVIETVIQTIRQEMDDGTGDRLEHFARLQDALTDLKKHVPKLPLDRNQWGKNLQKGAQELLTVARNEVARPERRQASHGTNSPDPIEAVGPSGPAPFASLKRQRILADIVDAESISDADDVRKFLRAVDDALAAVLSRDSATYESVLSEIESQILRSFADAD